MFFSQKNKILSIIIWIACIFSSIFSHVSAAPEDLYKSVLKIKVYSQDPISWHFSFSHYWSAVLIDAETIITNAHVVMWSEDNKTTWFYEICSSKSTNSAPICFTTARLTAYDSIDDIAVLKLEKPSRDIRSIPLKQDSQIGPWEAVVIYWYPSIWWSTITRTEWKIWWIDTNNSYKFDGTMDYGNSWWAAMSPKGDLIWIPYAIKSDNSVIWYIIPVQKIIKFIKSWKSDPIEQIETTNFKKYIKNIQAVYWKNIIKDGRINLSNINKNWFNLINRVGSLSGTVAYYHLVDKKNRTSIVISCWADAYTSWDNAITANKLFLDFSDNNASNIESTKSEFLNNEKSIYTVEKIKKIDKDGDKFTTKIHIYRDAPTCTSYIFSNDGYNKDKASYTNAQKLLNTLKFEKTPKVTRSFISWYFSLKNIPDNTIVSEGFQFLDEFQIFPEISVLFPISKSYATSSFELIKFDDIDGYMNYWYSDASVYKWKSYSFQSFFNRYQTTQYSNVVDYEVYTEDKKPLIMTVEDYTDFVKYAWNPTQVIIFFYPFQLNWKFYAYKMTFTLKWNNQQDVYYIRDIIRKIEFPGVSPFTKS